MAAILTIAVIRPSDGKVVKINADEAIFYTQRGWKRADDVGKTSGGEPQDEQPEQPKVEQPKVEQLAPEDTQPEPKETTDDLSAIII